MTNKETPPLKELERRLKRLTKQKDALEKEHHGNEQNFTYHAGFSLGYLKGKIDEIENKMDDIDLNNTFQKDLLVGQEVEKKVLTYVQKLYPKAYLLEGYNPQYDIFIPEKNRGIEIKYDRKSLRTKNCFIEVSSSGKDSGIKITKAFYWFIVTGKELIIIQVKKIREIIKDMEISEGVSEGDNYKKTRYLPKMDLIKEKAYKVERFEL